MIVAPVQPIHPHGKSLSVTENTLLISVMMSFSSSFFIADCTELADARLCRLMNAAEVIRSASPSLAMA